MVDEKRSLFDVRLCSADRAELLVERGEDFACVLLTGARPVFAKQSRIFAVA
jgi:hypothetical protein